MRQKRSTCAIICSNTRSEEDGSIIKLFEIVQPYTKIAIETTWFIIRLEIDIICIKLMTVV